MVPPNVPYTPLHAPPRTTRPVSDTRITYGSVATTSPSALEHHHSAYIYCRAPTAGLPSTHPVDPKLYEDPQLVSAASTLLCISASGRHHSLPTPSRSLRKLRTRNQSPAHQGKLQTRDRSSAHQAQRALSKRALRGDKPKAPLKDDDGYVRRAERVRPSLACAERGRGRGHSSHDMANGPSKLRASSSPEDMEEQGRLEREELEQSEMNVVNILAEQLIMIKSKSSQSLQSATTTTATDYTVRTPSPVFEQDESSQAEVEPITPEDKVVTTPKLRRSARKTKRKASEAESVSPITDKKRKITLRVNSFDQ